MPEKKHQFKFAIIHFMPLEYYPPTINLLTFIGKHSDINKLKVYTCSNVRNRKEYNISSINPKDITHEIIRFSFPKSSDSLIKRSFKYLKFNLITLINLILLKPHNILYYEVFSAWPVYIYSKYLNRNCQIFIHNHEYYDKSWYSNTMKQVKYYHKLEKSWLYKKTVWISQTNETRLELFHNDHPYIKKEILKVMPNYPPVKWSKQCRISNNKANIIPLKIVYIGSLSLKNTYIKELCDWVIQQNGEILFDIYSYNIEKKTSLFLESLESKFIKYYKDGIEYNDIPKVLNKYSVGVILYKAFSLNYINNVTNKFYEYYACGLDIWFSKTMKSTYQHINPETYPRVIPIDFTRLKYFNWQKAANKNGLQKNEETFYCEDVYEKLVDELVK